jgi:predicted dienelactone hydrolase
MGRILFSVFLIVVWNVSAHAQNMSFHAGFIRMTVSYEQPFPMAVWYPTHATEKPWKVGHYQIEATSNAPMAPGPFPLLLLSHGSGGSEFGHHDWAEYLARHGYVVAAPRHLGDSFDQPDGRGSDIQLIGRLWQVTKALDAVLADHRFTPSIDAGRIGMIGFSAGGYTTLASIGAEPNFNLWEAHCKKHPEDSEFCPSMIASLFSSLPRITRPDWEMPHETRIKAAVVMAPVAILYDSAGLSGVTVPLRVYRAANDHRVRNALNADIVIAGLPVSPEQMTVPGGHYVFLAPPSDKPASKLRKLFDDAPGVDRVTIHKQISKELVKFFNRTFGEK